MWILLEHTEAEVSLLVSNGSKQCVMLPLHPVSYYNSKPNKMQHQATVVTLGGVQEEEGKAKLALQVLKKFQQFK